MQDNLKAYIAEKVGDFEFIFVHGDFNVDHAELTEKLFYHGSHKPAITTNTTLAGRALDNIMIPDDDVEYVASVVETDHVYSHHPIRAKINTD